MEMLFAVHYKLRKGLGPEFVPKLEEVFLDDLPEQTTFEEAKAMAISEFKEIRLKKGTTDREYYITDVISI